MFTALLTAPTSKVRKIFRCQLTKQPPTETKTGEINKRFRELDTPGGHQANAE